MSGQGGKAAKKNRWQEQGRDPVSCGKGPRNQEADRDLQRTTEFRNGELAFSPQEDWVLFRQDNPYCPRA